MNIVSNVAYLRTTQEIVKLRVSGCLLLLLLLVTLALSFIPPSPFTVILH